MHIITMYTGNISINSSYIVWEIVAIGRAITLEYFRLGTSKDFCTNVGQYYETRVNYFVSKLIRKNVEVRYYGGWTKFY